MVSDRLKHVELADAPLELLEQGVTDDERFPAMRRAIN
jgi:hypothetical protein